MIPTTSVHIATCTKYTWSDMLAKVSIKK